MYYKDKESTMPKSFCLIYMVVKTNAIHYIMSQAKLAITTYNYLILIGIIELHDYMYNELYVFY